MSQIISQYNYPGYSPVAKKVIIAVIGFPKSGNTWLARLISATVNGCLYAESNDKITNSDTFYSDKDKSEVLIIKRHDSSIKGLQKFIQSLGYGSVKIKTIYIRRDIRDVTVSAFYFNYPFWSRLPRVIQLFMMPFKYFEFFLIPFMWHGPLYTDLFKLHLKKRQKIGSWYKHCSYWSEKADYVVDYEILYDHPKEVLIKALDSIAVTYEEQEAEKSVRYYNFDKSKKRFSNTGDKINARFLRRGGYGTWRSEMPGFIEKIIKNKS